MGLRLPFASITSKLTVTPVVLVGFFRLSEKESARAVRVTLDVSFRSRVEYLLKVASRARIIGVIYNSGQNETVVSDGEKVCAQMGLTLKKFPVNSAEDIRKLGDMGIDALIFIPDTLVCQGVIIREIILNSIKYKIPVVGISHFFAEAGTVMAIAPDYTDLGSQAGSLAIKILSGEKPSDMNFIFPDKVNYFLNQAVAHRQGLKIAQDVLDNAVEVFGQ